MVQVCIDLDDSNYSNLMRVQEIIAKLPARLTPSESREINALLKSLRTTALQALLKSTVVRVANNNVCPEKLQTAIFDSLPLFHDQN